MFHTQSINQSINHKINQSINQSNRHFLAVKSTKPLDLTSANFLKFWAQQFILLANLPGLLQRVWCSQQVSLNPDEAHSSWPSKNLFVSRTLITETMPKKRRAGQCFSQFSAALPSWSLGSFRTGVQFALRYWFYVTLSSQAVIAKKQSLQAHNHSVSSLAQLPQEGKERCGLGTLRPTWTSLS